MKRPWLALTVGFLTFLGNGKMAAAPPAPAPPRAVEIAMFGIGPAVDSAAFSVLRATLGSLVAQGSLDKFIVLGHGFEGGFSACVELSPFEDDEELKTIERQLRSIRPNPRTTSYSIRTVSACP